MSRMVGLTLITAIAGCGEGTSQDNCPHTSKAAIFAGTAAQEFCYGHINPEASNWEIPILEKCLQKSREAVKLIDQAENSCADQGHEKLAEIADYSSNIRNSIKLFELMKDIKEGTATKEDLRIQLLERRQDNDS